MKEILATTTLPRIAVSAPILAAFFFVVISFAMSSFSSSSSSTQYSLTIGSLYGTTYGSGSYSNGTTVNFGVSPTSVYDSAGTTRYVFAGWSCTGNGCYSGSSPSASVVMNNNIAESANWITQYLLSTSVTGNGSVNLPGQNWYNAGSTVSVSEASQGAGGWIFAYWELDGQNVGASQTYAVSMSSPHDLVANFIDAEIQSKLVNVTDSYGNNLRNPDGSFYRLDEFEIQYNVTIVGGNATLPASITFEVSLSYHRNVLDEITNGSGYVIFIVLPSATYAPYNVTLSASIINSADGSMRPIPNYGHEPFAVVDYSPHFTYFSYNDYNALNSSTYERPFVVLVRYDGNSPGYSYSGDINTDPFSSSNSTGERAVVNTFTFSTKGWSISSNLNIVNDSLSVINFLYHPSLSLSVALLNGNKTGSPTILTWSDRVHKFYFLSNIPEIKNYVNTDSIIYFNVTVNAWYGNTYDSVLYQTNNFNTSYLYQPIFYNGYLVFKPYGGSQANFSVSVVSHNPSSLDSYLVSQATSVFGNYTSAISSLEQDLYPAYSTTILKPLVSSSQEWVFLVNQTNFAASNSDAMPFFTISISGKTGYTDYTYEANEPPGYLSAPVTQYSQTVETTTYNVSYYFGLFGMSDFPVSSSFPAQELIGYYFMQPNVGDDLVMQPLNFSFSPSASIPYLIRTYSNLSAPFFVSFEPGNLTDSYSMIYGENSTTAVSVNLVGGGITGLDGTPTAVNGGTEYEVTLVIGNQSGGASDVWVVGDEGQVLYNESLLPSSSPSISGLFGPAGYVGEYSFQFPVENTSSSSVTIYVENSWGGLSIIQGVQITPQSPPVLYYSPSFLAIILIVAFGISSGYTILGRKNRMKGTQS
jgi:hypothetical protein